MSSGRPLQDAPQLFGGDSRREQPEETTPPATLSALLALLSAGPASQGFESTIQALGAKNFQSGPQDRAGSRKLICDHGWFVDVFRPYDQAEFEGILVMIFWHSVIPDLDQRQVSGELADWAGKLAAPAVVIRALYATTDGAPGTRQLMDQALRPALSWRWLNENGIRPPAAAQGPAAVSPPVRDTASGSRDAGAGAQAVTAQQAAAQQAAARPSGGPPTLQSVLDHKVTMPLSLVLAICVAVIVLLVATR